MADPNNLVKSENLKITCDYPIPNVYSAALKKSPTEKTDISEKDVSQQHRSSPVINSLSGCPLIKTEKIELRGTNAGRNLTEHLCHTEKSESTALMKDNGNLNPQPNQIMESVPARTTAIDKGIVCDFCWRKFSCFSDLTKHQRCHTAKQPRVCDICHKELSCLSKLVRHRRSHTGEKPFVCDICDKSFSQTSSLKAHKRSHSGEKPFNCDFCEKRFSRAIHLSVHRRIHTGEKPYVCELCDRQFAHANSLERHKRTHAEEKPFVGGV